MGMSDSVHDIAHNQNVERVILWEYNLCFILNHLSLAPSVLSGNIIPLYDHSWKSTHNSGK